MFLIYSLSATVNDDKKTRWWIIKKKILVRMRSNSKTKISRDFARLILRQSVSGVSQCGTEFCLFVSGVGGKNEPLT